MAGCRRRSFQRPWLEINHPAPTQGHDGSDWEPPRDRGNQASDTLFVPDPAALEVGELKAPLPCVLKECLESHGTCSKAGVRVDQGSSLILRHVGLGAGCRRRSEVAPFRRSNSDRFQCRCPPTRNSPRLWLWEAEDRVCPYVLSQATRASGSVVGTGSGAW